MRRGGEHRDTQSSFLYIRPQLHQSRTQLCKHSCSFHWPMLTQCPLHAKHILRALHTFAHFTLQQLTEVGALITLILQMENLRLLSRLISW